MCNRSHTIRSLLSVLVITSWVAAVGCDDAHQPNPVGPTSVVITGLSIGGVTSIARPGETTQLTAIATFSDETSRDVTTEATWTAMRHIVTIVSRGVARADAYGVDDVRVTYAGISRTASVRVAPPGAYLLPGTVHSEGGVPLAAAHVESASACGTVSTMTGSYGEFVLPVQGAATLQVELQGFPLLVREVVVESDGRMDITLPNDRTGDLGGTYRLTVSASPSCAMPPEAMQRQYDAFIEQMGDSVFVTLDGADLVAWAGMTGFTGTRDGQTVHFVIRATFDDGFNLVERIAPDQDLYFSGTADAVIADPLFTATFNGTIELRRHATSLASCTATDHRLEFKRSGTQ